MAEMEVLAHAVLEEQQLRIRVIVIGDVHGCLEELRLLLRECSFDEETDILIFVGDLVNKGPSSVGVLRFVRDLTLRGIAYSVIGNHDEALLENALLPPHLRPEKYSYLEELRR
jgi:bis(5'-nucleosyl)-tetraphosphatase (symmetrical)